MVNSATPSRTELACANTTIVTALAQFKGVNVTAAGTTPTRGVLETREITTLPVGAASMLMVYDALLNDSWTVTAEGAKPISAGGASNSHTSRMLSRSTPELKVSYKLSVLVAVHAILMDCVPSSTSSSGELTDTVSASAQAGGVNSNKGGEILSCDACGPVATQTTETFAVGMLVNDTENELGLPPSCSVSDTSDSMMPARE